MPGRLVLCTCIVICIGGSKQMNVSDKTLGLHSHAPPLGFSAAQPRDLRAPLHCNVLFIFITACLQIKVNLFCVTWSIGVVNSIMTVILVSE